MDSLLILRLSATAALPAIFMASRLSVGSAPGKPRQTGQVLLFGSLPNSVEQAQKIFESVLSCAWTSRPMTASQPSFTDVLLAWRCERKVDSTAKRRTGQSTVQASSLIARLHDNWRAW